jgi:TatD DNase family protein
MGAFDVHAHLTHPKLAADLDGVLARAKAAGVTTILSNGLNPSDNAATAALAAREPIVKACFGFYPVDTVLADMEAMGIDYPREAPAVSAEEGIAWVRAHAEGAFAIGEIGLDGHWVPEGPLWQKQEEAFRALVEIALEHDKPVILHTRKRERRTLEILRELGAKRVDWHCFGGRVNLGREIAEGGHYLSIPAHARRSQAFARLLETLPRDRVLLETDCPYLGPVPGVDNEPANVAGTIAFAAELWRTDEASVLAQLSENFERLFGVAP